VRIWRWSSSAAVQGKRQRRWAGNPCIPGWWISMPRCANGWSIATCPVGSNSGWPCWRASILRRGYSLIRSAGRPVPIRWLSCWSRGAGQCGSAARGAVQYLLTEGGGAHAGPAAEGPGEAARVEKPQLIGDAGQRQLPLTDHANGGFPAHFVHQLFVGGPFLAQLAAQVAWADVHRTGHPFHADIAGAEQQLNAAFDLLHQIIGRLAGGDVLQGIDQPLADEGIRGYQWRLQQAQRHGQRTDRTGNHLITFQQAMTLRQFLGRT